MPPSLDNLTAALLRWYDGVHADRGMPWRQTRDPYAIWISEIMLQQTQVETVKPYFARFLARFPTVGDLAGADLQEVLAHWAGLGYYRRAKHLHAAAREIVRRFGGRLPGDVEGLRTLPGIGRYTAGAIASIAFGRSAPVVDGNVMRVLARLTAYDKDIGQAKHQVHFWELADAIHRARGEWAVGRQGADEPRHGDINQALMELGATVCTPANPACAGCPIRGGCRASAEGRQADFPVKAAKKAAPVVRLAAWVILRQSRAGKRVLLMQRQAGGLWEGMWEFPTVPQGKAATAARDFSRAFGFSLAAAQRAGRLTHQLTHRTLEYRVFSVKVNAETPLSRPFRPAHPYVKAKWLAWPLAKRHALPLAAVVHKIAALAARG